MTTFKPWEYYLCAFSFMYVKMRAPIGVCKDVADRVLKNV